VAGGRAALQQALPCPCATKFNNSLSQHPSQSAHQIATGQAKNARPTRPPTVLRVAVTAGLTIAAVLPINWAGWKLAVGLLTMGPSRPGSTQSTSPAQHPQQRAQSRRLASHILHSTPQRLALAVLHVAELQPADKKSSDIPGPQWRHF
jgi:hypothetical protein